MTRNTTIATASRTAATRYRSPRSGSGHMALVRTRGCFRGLPTQTPFGLRLLRARDLVAELLHVVDRRLEDARPVERAEQRPHPHREPGGGHLVGERFVAEMRAQPVRLQPVA